MPGFVLVSGDTAIFLPVFGAATVVVSPGTLTGTGPASVNGRKMCVDGDEKKVVVPGCAYMTAQHTIPGAGTLEISALGGDQKATKTQTGGTKVLLVGSTFTAKFTVSAPAQQIIEPSTMSMAPDTTPQYTGSGTFISTNVKFRGF